MLVQEDALLDVEIMKSLVEKYFGWMWRWLRCFGEVIGGSFGEVLGGFGYVLGCFREMLGCFWEALW